MSTALQNTEVEESLIKQISEGEQTTFNPLDGELTEEGENDEGVVADGEDGDEESSEPDGEDSEEVKLPEGDLEEEESDGEGESEDVEDAEEVAEDSEGLSATIAKVAEARDYSKYNEEDAKFLKQMSNEAFEHFSKRSQELQALAQQVDDKPSNVSADHPDAYVLSDEYKETYANYSKSQREQQHWRNQLIKIRNGEPWQNIEGYDKSDSIVISKGTFKPTQQAEIDVEMALQEAVGLNRKFSDSLNNVSHTHKANYNDAVTLLEREQNANFAWRTDEKVAQEKIVLPKVGATTIQTIKDDFSKALPKTFRSHPMSELASNLFVTLQLQIAHSSSENVKAKESKRKEPKARRKSSKASASDGSDLSVPDWMNL